MAGDDCCQEPFRFGIEGYVRLEGTINGAVCAETFIRADACQLRIASVASPLL